MSRRRSANKEGHYYDGKESEEIIDDVCEKIEALLRSAPPTGISCKEFKEKLYTTYSVKYSEVKARTNWDIQDFIAKCSSFCEIQRVTKKWKDGVIVLRRPEDIGVGQVRTSDREQSQPDGSDGACALDESDVLGLPGTPNAVLTVKKSKSLACVEELRANVVALLRSALSHRIRYERFWLEYKRHFGDIDPKAFGYGKKGKLQLLKKFCSDLIIVDGFLHDQEIVLREEKDSSGGHSGKSPWPASALLERAIASLGGQTDDISVVRNLNNQEVGLQEDKDISGGHSGKTPCSPSALLKKAIASLGGKADDAVIDNEAEKFTRCLDTVPPDGILTSKFWKTYKELHRQRIQFTVFGTSCNKNTFLDACVDAGLCRIFVNSLNRRVIAPALSSGGPAPQTSRAASAASPTGDMADFYDRFYNKASISSGVRGAPATSQPRGAPATRMPMTTDFMSLTGSNPNPLQPGSVVRFPTPTAAPSSHQSRRERSATESSSRGSSSTRSESPMSSNQPSSQQSRWDNQIRTLRHNEPQAWEPRGGREAQEVFCPNDAYIAQQQAAMMNHGPRGPRWQNPRHPHFQHRGPRMTVSKDHLKNVVEDAIDRLAESKTYVSVERIEQLILQSFNISSLFDIGIQRVENIPAVNEHLRKQCKVNAYIQAFVKVRSIATIHELHENLKEFCAEGHDFEHLKLGPIIKQPLVYEFFKFPEDKDVYPPLNTGDLLELLRNYLTQKNLWKEKIEIEGFMEFLMKHFDLETPYELGVRIRSPPLALQVLKKAQREAGQAMRGVSGTLQQQALKDLETAIKNLSISFIDNENGRCIIRRHYATLPANAVLDEISSKMKVLMDSLTYIQQVKEVPGLVQKNWNRNRQSLDNFSAHLRNDVLFRTLFQVAVCSSREELHIQLQELFSNVNETIDLTDDGEAQSGAGHVKPPAAIGELIAAVQKYLERCIAHRSLNLTHLARIEDKLLEDLNYPNFPSMGHGNFLAFLLNTKEIQQMMDECGGGLMGTSSSGAVATDSAYHPSFSDLVDFVRQCRITDGNMTDLLEGALCQHYAVREVKQLGHGGVAHLMKAASKHKAGSSQDNNVLYESALTAKLKDSSIRGSNKQVGLMGHQTKEKALSCLQNCPLLENLAEWSHWDLVFRPELGDLKDFIQKYGGIYTCNIAGVTGKMSLTTKVVALETQPGILLKVTSETSPDKFLHSACDGNVRDTCGHLVSIIINNKCIDNTPLMLLGNHLKTALLKMQGESMSEVPGAPGSRRNGCKPAEFVLACLTQLPLVICQATANQVFLEPLTHVAGATRSKEVLLHQAQCDRQLTRLQILGCLLGIQEWANTFDVRTKLPEDCTVQEQLPQVSAFDSDIIELANDSDTQDIDEDEEEDEDEEKDIFLLSDDDEDEEKQDADEKTDKSAEAKKAYKPPLVTVESSGMSSDDVEILSETENDGKKDGNEERKNRHDSEKMDDDSNEVEMEVVETVTDAASPQQTIINKIRRDEFGVGVELSEDGQRLMEKQQQRLGRSLDRLSRDLYSKDTHFVLELVQNADDNDYSDSLHGGPAVKFTVNETAIVVQNNETGFEERNIRAICDVGKSTKGKHKYGYIGQKGIGFKSVFRITDAPEIHSAGFHMKFDVNSGPMGYILPHWIEDEDHVDSEDWQTTIMLPLKEQFCSAAQSQSLAARFQDVHPSLLLFLHRLKNITVVNKVENYELAMTRRDLGNQVVEIDSNGGTDRWLVLRKTLDASSISLQAKSGVDVESTEIALAFPLLPPDHLASVVQQKQPVFAFLPLRSYGFRFVIQGDFDVPSSREDVDKDSLWNQWLRSEIHHLFVEALEAFKTHPEFDTIEGVCRYMQFIPLEDEILDFFCPVASNILQQLRSRPCFPTQPGPGRAMEWKLPSQVVMTKDKLMKEIISAHQIGTTLSLSYLHDKVANVLHPSLVTALGIQTLSTDHLIEIGKGILNKIHAEDVLDISQAALTVGKWLACIYRSMDEFHVDDQLHARLQALPMIPLTNGQFVALNSLKVFFPLDKEEHRKRSTKKYDALLQLERDINTVSAELVANLDQVAASQVLRLLEQLGVKKLVPREVVQHYILPALKSDKWKEKTAELTVSYIIYLKEQVEQQPSLVSIDELKSAAVLLTNKGFCRVSEVAIHFSPEYGNAIDLNSRLPGYTWTILHDCYIGQEITGMDKQRWREFFIRLGVLDFISVKSATVSLSAKEMKHSAWAAHAELLPDQDATYQVVDYVCEEFEALVKKNAVPNMMNAQMRLLFEVLDRDWDSTYKRYQPAVIKDTQGNSIRDVESSFAFNLKKLPWVPANVSDVREMNGTLVPDQRLELRQGSSLFLADPKIQQVLAYTAAYLHSHPSPQSSFTQFLGVQTTVTMDYVQESLKRWSERDSSTNAPAEFSTTLNHIVKVYLTLQDNLPPKQLQDLLHSVPFIFVPQLPLEPGRVLEPQVIIRGRFLGRSEVRWTDPTGLFHKYREDLKPFHLDSVQKPALSKLYASLKDLFLQSARLDIKPLLKENLELMSHLTLIKPVSEALTDILTLMATVGNEINLSSQQDSPEGGILQMQLKDMPELLKDKKVFPTKGGEWVSLGQNPMISDNPELEKLFMGKTGVHIVELGEWKGLAGKRSQDRGPYRYHREQYGPDPRDVRVFLDVCGIRLLSACVKTEYVTEMFHPSPPLQKYMHDVLPFIQQHLYHADSGSVYDELLQLNVASRFGAMSFGSVSKLDVLYSFDHLPEVTATQWEKCRLTDDLNFYILKALMSENHREIISFTDLNKELARFFSRGSKIFLHSIRNLLLDLLPVLNNPFELQEKKRQIELPGSEQRWEVPEPIIRPPTPPPPPPIFSVEMMEVDDAASQCSETGSVAGSGGPSQAWPPQSGNPSGSFPPKRSQGAPQQWPLPARPKHYNVTDLPENLRPSQLAPMQTQPKSPESDRPPSVASDVSHASGRRPASPGSTVSRSDGQPRDPAAGQGQGHPQGHGTGQGHGSGQGSGRAPVRTGEWVDAPSQGTAATPGAPEDAAVSSARDEDGDVVILAEHASPSVSQAGQSGVPGERGSRDASRDADGVVMPPPTPGSLPPTPRGTPVLGKKRPRFESDGSCRSEEGTNVQFELPVWSAEVLETPYEELGTGRNLPLPDPGTYQADSDEAGTGRWGEMLVYNHLLAQQDRIGDQQVEKIDWVNANGESGFPYDMMIVRYDSETQTTTTTFIEVKATVSDKKRFFDMSGNEVQFALDKKENYHLYRVFNAGNEEAVRLTRLENLASLLAKNQVRLCLVV